MDGGRDRISELPDDILQRILSPLPIKEKARTSVLSRRWSHLWPSTPTLDFGDVAVDFMEYEVVSVVDRCLYLSTAKLQTLRLDLSFIGVDTYSVFLIDGWIHRADERSVSELHLFFGDFHYSFDQELPISIFRCRSLSVLKLTGCLFHLPSSASLNFCRNLRTLQLQDVEIANETLASVLSACTLLENLILFSLCGLTRLEISNQNCRLEQLVISKFQSNCRVVIRNAPNLRSILYHGNLSNLFMEKVPRLARVRLTSDFETPFPLRFDWRELFPESSNIEILSLNVPFLCTGKSKLMPRYFSVYMPTGIKRMDVINVYESLKELHLCDCALEKYRLYAVLYSLEHLASLEKLCLCLATYKVYYQGDELKGKVHPPPYEHLSYVMRRIKSITVVRFTGGYHEIQLANFVLWSAVALESLILNLAEDVRITEKLRLELLEIPRASRNARVIVSQVLDDKLCPRQYKLWECL